MEGRVSNIIFKKLPQEEPIAIKVVDEIAPQEFLRESELILRESNEIDELRRIILELAETQVQFYAGT